MDLAEGKSSQTRTNAFITLTNLLQKRVMLDFLLSQHETLSRLVERSLKKGHTKEQIEAARLFSVLVISLCQVQEAEQIYEMLRPLFLVILMDSSTTPCLRQQCTNTLSICTFITCQDLEVVMEVMDTLRTVYKSSLTMSTTDDNFSNVDSSSLSTAALNDNMTTSSLGNKKKVYVNFYKNFPQIPTNTEPYVTE
ncbi:hypothetical protein Pmani_008196 [Petrolisthes manimaculis]|uniref:Interferon-related developmental regulator N-terminal domain-containing protein n=1 Tax=Petrolisthes manimaculis TaxID=1843537 RepID=A0AAE1Q6S5_9EUCA|nr:hypothetical protein Pmani_008196 [Petrolisthes manimaculis]